ANLVFAAATQGWFMARNRAWEAVVLLLVTFTLFRPGFWMDMIHPPYDKVAPTRIMEVIEKAPTDDRLRVWVEGEDINAKKIYKGVLLPLGQQAPALQRLNAAGLSLMEVDGNLDIMAVKFG
ncbi:MAG TPA: C4-dicarboxylate ABC transporter, partial [Candidatus Accumulibacter sp.]|nr:C4-dicarboxylate ABC transporter [Accumulibacter sp.]